MLVYGVAEENQGHGGSWPRDILHMCTGDGPRKPPQSHRQRWCPDGKAEETFLWGGMAVGKAVSPSGMAVVQPSERAKEETKSDEEEDQSGLLSIPHVVCVDDREGDGEEVEEDGAEGVGQG